MQEMVKNNNENKEKNIEKKQTGITLIALVITIIVLLILAGVSIATLTGNNGILTQANQAKENNNSAAAKEKVEVEALGSIDKSGKFNESTFEENATKNIKGSTVKKSGSSLIVTVDGYDVTVDKETGEVTGIVKSNGETPSASVQPGTEVSKTEKDNYTDSNKEKATIPEGFTVDETENTISSGLVVHGPDGSEFVWVPVPDINTMAQCSTAGRSCNLQLDGETLKCTTHNSTDIVGKLYATSTGENFGTENTTYNADSGLREPAYLTDSMWGDASNSNTIGLTLWDIQRDYKNMPISVAKYGGFYVGRYETSLSNATSSQANDGNPQSKPKVIPSSAANSATSSWYGLYSKQKTYTGKNNSVESSMIWGSQYDAMLNWIKSGTDKYKITNTSLGNHSGNITTTGNDTYSNDSINNIRDLGGNLNEWTLEAQSSGYRTYRGGDFYDSNSPSYSNKLNGMPPDLSASSGSRLTLYVK
ncbi:MAG: hypothetical protein V8R81_03015 [Clostridia bacterium]